MPNFIKGYLSKKSSSNCGNKTEIVISDGSENEMRLPSQDEEEA